MTVLDGSRTNHYFRVIFSSLLALFVLALSGCTTITLVPAYDSKIDDSLTDLYADTTVFVDRMIESQGTPAGTYAANAEFYDEARGTVEALIVRAEAHRVLDNCPSTKLVNSALASVAIPEAARAKIGTLPDDDCQVVLMRLIKGGFEDMARFHEAQGDRGIPAVGRSIVLDGGVGAMLRAAITVEIAKRAE